MTATITYHLALDLSLKRPGAAILAVSDTAITIEAVSHTSTNERLNRGERATQIEAWLTDFIATNTPTARLYAKEDAPPSAVTGAILNRVHGAVELALAPRDWVDIPQGTVKSIVVGRGGADVTKLDVETAIRRHLALGDEFNFATDDEADAVSVGLAYLTLIDVLPQPSRYNALRSNLNEWLTEGTAKQKRDRAKFIEKIRKAAQKTTKGAKVA